MTEASGRGIALERIQNPSRVLLAYEVNAALRTRVAGGGQDRFEFHGGTLTYPVAFVDGHVRLLKIEPGVRVSDAYSFYWHEGAPDFGGH
jgi:prepilin-type processing-associated H-X9-DG protein